MQRRKFIQTSAAASAAAISGLSACNLTEEKQGTINKKATNKPYPLAITMWEFSWLERKWPGAGYEDWDRALSELVERGYDAIRIDAFPHLIYNEPEREYLLLPHWHTQDWGSPEINRVQVQPNLNKFLERCRYYNIRVGLSSWFRMDEDDLSMKLTTPEILADAWLAVLSSIDEGGLLDTIFYVDLCNEWTGDAWCPFFVNDPPEALWTGWHTEKSREWMKTAIEKVQTKYPYLPCTFSFTGEITKETLNRTNLEMLDFLEPHIWMTSFNGGEFYREVGYAFERYDYTGYRNLALNAESAYTKRKQYWKDGLTSQIKIAAEWSRITQRPMITTECWGVVDYKDWPLLEWDWVKELCAIGTTEASNTGRWLAISTSNFCGPQFKGMWRDIDWHRKLTDIIHQSALDPELEESLLAKRMVSVQKNKAQD